MVEEKQENPLHAKEEGRAEGSSEETTGNGRSLGVFSFEGDIPLTQAVPLGLQHVLAMRAPAMLAGNFQHRCLRRDGACGLLPPNHQLRRANRHADCWRQRWAQLPGIGPAGGRRPAHTSHRQPFAVASMGFTVYGVITGRFGHRCLFEVTCLF